MDLKPYPVILDTDLGDDIDDTWALGFMLKCPEIDLKMVVTDRGNTKYRSSIVAKFLDLAGRSDIPVATGIQQDTNLGGQAEWVKDYDISTYSGTVYEAGVQAMIDMIMTSEVPLYLVCIGPVPNIARALEIEPAIAGKCHFVGMHGSINESFEGIEGPIAEWNVVCDAKACQKVFKAPWLSRTITPLDTCAKVKLTGDLYQQIATSEKTIPSLIIENYRHWAQVNTGHDSSIVSSILFDTVAAWLVFSRDYLDVQPLNISVTDEGFTVIDDENGVPVDTALFWHDLDAYQAELVRRLLSE